MTMTFDGKTPLPEYVIREPKSQYRFSRALSKDEIVSLAKQLLMKEVLLDEVIHPTNLFRFAVVSLFDKKEEEVIGVFLNEKYRLLGYEALGLGTIDHVNMHIRRVMQAALRYNAANLVLMHNHPSGSTAFSQDDLTFTKHLKKALTLIDVEVLDHLLVAGFSCVSMVETGVFPKDAEK